MNNCSSNKKINKIKVLLGKDLEMIEFAYSSLFLATPMCESFKNLNLSGLLCFIIDHREKARYLILFNEFTYEILFRYELYYNFDDHYQVLSVNFHCFEVENGIIGVFFKNNTEANKFSLTLIKFDDNSSKKYFENYDSLSTSYIKTEKELQKKYKIIKDKLSNSINIKTNNNLNTSILEINNMNQLEILNTLTFNKKSGLFKIKKLSEETKHIFKAIGLVQDDLENTKFTLELFKNIIKEYENYYNYDNDPIESEVKETTPKTPSPTPHNHNLKIIINKSPNNSPGNSASSNNNNNNFSSPENIRSKNSNSSLSTEEKFNKDGIFK